MCPPTRLSTLFPGKYIAASRYHRARHEPDGHVQRARVGRWYSTAVARLTIRIDLASHGSIGPGKIRLLELIGEFGSISAAGRAMGMSYRRAWTLIDGLNQCFRSPAVETQLGGLRGGGAVLTDLGHDVIARYRAVERAAAKASAPELAALDAARAAQPTAKGGRGRRITSTGARQRSPLMPRHARR